VERALTLQKQLDDVGEKQRLQQEQLDALKQKIFGKRSEKMPPMEREARRDEQPDPAKSLLKRQADAELRAAKIKTEVVDVPVPAPERHCPHCGGDDFANARCNSVPRPATEVASLPMVNVATSHWPSTKPSPVGVGNLTSGSSVSRALVSAAKLSNL
jgi:hypothetical protein